MPARRTVRRRRRAERPAIPEHLLDPGGRIPADVGRLWHLLAYLAEVDPEEAWHDPFAVLTALPDERLDDLLDPLPAHLTEGTSPR